MTPLDRLPPREVMYVTGVSRHLEKLLPLGKSLVFFFALSVPVDFSIVTEVYGKCFITTFCALISSGSCEEAVIDVDTVERQVTYTAIQGSTSEEGSEHS